MGNVRREFEVIDDGEDFGDVVKYGKPSDQRDMARMGKIQEMRVRLSKKMQILFPKFILLLTRILEKLQVSYSLWLQRHSHVLVGIATKVTRQTTDQSGRSEEHTSELQSHS